jgi:cell volume regulation protein A
MLIGSIISSTDSASVFAILRSKSVNLKGNLKPLLELESGSNDPMAYMLTIVSISLVKYSDITISRFIFMVIMQMAIGLISGLSISKLALYFISKVQFVNRSFYHIILLAMLFFVFSFTDLINGNGFLAVYVAGLTIGNSKVQCDSSAYTFFDGIAWLSQLVLFLTLGLLVNPLELIKIEILTMGFIVSFILIFISRPFAVFSSLLPFKEISNRSKHYISWVGLRGAVPIVFATYPLIEGIPKADIIFNIVFFVTIVSLIVQGSSISFVAQKIGLLQD